MKHLFGLVFTLAIAVSASQAEESPFKAKPEEAVLLTVQVRRVPTTEVNAYIHNDQVFLPMVEVFNMLRIRIDHDTINDVVSGYFMTRDSAYTFELKNFTFAIGRSHYVLNDSEYIPEKRDVFLRIDKFRTIFGLNFIFSKATLSVRLKDPRRDLPIYRLQAVQREIERGRTDQEVAFPIERKYSFDRLIFSAGAFEYSGRYVRNSVGRRNIASLNYKTGMELLWGDLNVTGRTASNRKLSKQDYRGTLTYAFTDNPVFSQVILGDLSTGISQFKPEIFGAEVTNRPAAYPYRFTSEEDLSEYFGPNRTILLSDRGRTRYLGTVGENGIFRNIIPLSYGLNTLRFRSYDYWADEVDKSFLYNVPINFIRPGEVQYTIFAGKSRIQTSLPFYGMGNLQWGVNSNITMGAMMESYRSTDVDKREYYPTLFAYTRLAKALLFNASVSPMLQSKAVLDLTLPTLANFNVGITQFKRNSPINFRNADLELDASATLPFYGPGGGAALITDFQQLNLPGAIERTFQGSITAAYQSFEPSATYIVGSTRRFGATQITTQLSQYGFRVQLPLGVVVDNQLSYNHLTKKFLEYDLFVGKNIGSALLSLNYRKTFDLYDIASISLRYLFPFVQSKTSYSRTGTQTAFEEDLSGSILLSTITRDILFDRNTTRTRTGNIFVDVFEDVNNNGKRDDQERLLPITSVEVRSEYGYALATPRGKDHYDIRSLTAYGNYGVSLRRMDIDNPILVPLFSSFSVTARPAQFIHIDVPLVVGGTVRGLVEEVSGTTRLPVEAVSVTLEPVDSALALHRQTVKTFSTGEFELTHILPGNYRITLDARELAQAGFKSKITSRPVSIQAKPEGDLIENVNFELTR